MKKPHLVFFLSIPIIMLIGVLNGYSTLDINIHDTYFVVAHLHLAILISILFGIIGCTYWAIQKANGKLSKWLNLIHIVLTIGGLVAIFTVPPLLFAYNTESNFPLYDNLILKNLILISMFFLMMFGQLIYLINITIGIFRKVEQ